MATSFEINILQQWCTNLCVIKTQGYGSIRDSGGFVESYHGTSVGCEKSGKGSQNSFLSLRLSSNLSLFLSTPARPCFLGPHWSKRKSTQASGTLLSLMVVVQSQSSGCTAVSLGLGLSFFIFLGIFNTAFARSKKSLNPFLNSADTFFANMSDRSLVTNVFGQSGL